MSDEANTLAGWSPELDDEAAVREAIDKAFDYRGDVTVGLAGGEALSGYLFDREPGPTLAESRFRLMPADGSANRTIPYDQIEAIRFGDRDPASGRSWETWVRKYVEKKSRGEAANIYNTDLEEGDGLGAASGGAGSPTGRGDDRA